MRIYTIICAGIFAGALALAGCNHDDGGHGNNDMGVGGSGGDGGGLTGGDMALSGDMADPGTPPAPSAMHVGATGNTSNLVSDGVAGHAAYLVNAAPVMSGSTPLGIAGELHVVDAAGHDTMLASNVFQHGYQLAPDGSCIFWVGFDPTNGPKNGTASLNFFSLLAANAMPKQLVATGMPVTNTAMPGATALYTANPLTSESFFAPSGKYFLVGIAAAVDSTTPDLHVFDQNGMDVYQRPNGGAVYSQLVLPDDTMLFQDTAAGTGPSAPPVQTMYWVTLPGGTATAVTTHTSSFQPSVDGKTIVILKTGGDLLTWSLANKSTAPATLATGAALFTIGTTANGPVAWVGGDHTVHVVGLDGTKLLDVAAGSANADVFGTIKLSPTASDVYWFANAEQQANRGTLMHAKVASGASANKVADKISMPDLAVTDSAIVFLQNVDDLGQLGDVAWAALDGSSVTALGQKAAVGHLQVANPAAMTWYALHGSGDAVDATHAPIDGSPAITGAVALASSTGDVQLASAAHEGAFRLSDSGKAAVFVGGTAWNATVNNFVGALSFVQSSAPATVVDGKLAGVSEVGPIVARKLFVSAPAASPAGIYFATY